ncbi:MAG TPA: GntR family transcriptional regulator [Pseudonocardia sp.]|jgi:DNA-binding GntR family transcriptional regulator|uniref:GntR family transcriptional regulator n=1 Tax=Pseudonocardia sp. TaxID=60912 RepID=UPI002F41C346
MTEPASVRRIEAVSVVDRVTAELRRAIISCAMQPGQEFSLRQIASQLGISFIPVREALRTLEADGLLITRRGRSAVVAPLDPDGLAGLVRLRKLIEPDLMAQAATRFRPAELDRLELRIPLVNWPQCSTDELHEAQLDFQADLLRPAATQWDLKVLERLWQGVARYLHMGYAAVTDQPSAFRALEQGHRALIAAFRDRDPERARAESESQLERDAAIGRLGLGTGQ